MNTSEERTNVRIIQTIEALAGEASQSIVKEIYSDIIKEIYACVSEWATIINSPKDFQEWVEYTTQASIRDLKTTSKEKLRKTVLECTDLSLLEVFLIQRKYVDLSNVYPDTQDGIEVVQRLRNSIFERALMYISTETRHDSRNTVDPNVDVTGGGNKRYASLILCPDCHQKVSSMADSCPNCGCPVKLLRPEGPVRIKLPHDIVEGFAGLFSSRNAQITNESGEALWKGLHGENASFFVKGPTQIKIMMGGWANPVTGMVAPHKKYALVQDMGVHLFATYRITEVDVIDAD